MMVHRSDLEKLARTHAVPAVTVLLATDRRRPGNADDPYRLDRLVHNACDQLRRDYEISNGASLLERLRSAKDVIDWHHPTEGLAIFASADELHVVTLPFTVEERVVVDDMFSTRELVLGLQRLDRYRALVLSGRRARLFEGTGTAMSEVTDGGFPMDLEAPVEEDAPHRDLPLRDNRRAAAHAFVFRAVDRALNERTAADPLPLVVVAVERDLAFFDEVTAHGRVIIGRARGDHTHDSAARITELTAPIAHEHFDRRRADAVRDIEAAVGAHKGAIGVDNVVGPAREGRGRLLVVDDTLTFDALDETIDAVLAHGGEVVMVGSGALGVYGPVALALRY